MCYRFLQLIYRDLHDRYPTYMYKNIQKRNNQCVVETFLFRMFVRGGLHDTTLSLLCPLKANSVVFHSLLMQPTFTRLIPSLLRGIIVYLLTFIWFCVSFMHHSCAIQIMASYIKASGMAYRLVHVFRTSSHQGIHMHILTSKSEVKALCCHVHISV